MPLIKRKIHVPCSGDECIKLYEILKDRIPLISYVELSITSKGLLIEAYGYESDIKDLWIEIKRILKPLREISRKSGLRRYSVDFLVQTTRKTFPPRVLVEVLKRTSHIVEYSSEENIIITNAQSEEITGLIEKIHESLREASDISGNTSTRYYLVASSVLTRLTISEIVNTSLKLGILEQNEKGKYILLEEWEKALDILTKNIKSTSRLNSDSG